MKKILSLVLALITLFCLVGCDNSKDIVLTDEDIHTDYAGVYLTLSSVDDSGEHKKLNAVWHNETFKEVTYGEGYKIEYLEDGEWKSVLKGEHIVSSIANLLKAKGTNEKSYSTDLFDLSKEGTYRLISDFSLGDGKMYNTWVTFEVKKASTDKLDNIQPGGTDVHDAFDIRITRTGWVEGVQFEGCLNLGKLAISSVHHLPLFRFSSLDELNVFKTKFSEGHFDCTMDGDTSFNEKTSDYDVAFFEKNDLFLVSVSAGSGSYRFDVNSVFNDGQYFCIYVNQTNNPECGTADMAGWFITVAVPKSATESCTAFDAIMGFPQ